MCRNGHDLRLFNRRRLGLQNRLLDKRILRLWSRFIGYGCERDGLTSLRGLLVEDIVGFFNQSLSMRPCYRTGSVGTAMAGN
jgi:hypothetical protein